MNTLCWPNIAKKIVQKEKELSRIRYPLVFFGLWFLNIAIALFGLPFLAFTKLKSSFR